jgi:hypothetical protein
MDKNMSNKIDEEKLKSAKEKLACHIEPPKKSAPDASQNGSVRLTEMTTAGG